MSYELFITKADYSWEIEDSPIQEAEWLEVANKCAELKISMNDCYSRKGDDGQIENYHPWLITSLPDNPPLWFIDGAINTTNPDIKTIKFMVNLAKRLDAKVIGEDGETYDESGEAFHT